MDWLYYYCFLLLRVSGLVVDWGWVFVLGLIFIMWFIRIMFGGGYSIIVFEFFFGWLFFFFKKVFLGKGLELFLVIGSFLKNWFFYEFNDYY